MYKSIKLSCSLHSSLSLKTEYDATSFSHTSAKPSRSHARTSGHIARSRPLEKLFIPVSRRRWFSFAENMTAAKFRLQCADYNGCEGHLTGILPLFFLFKLLFSMEIENFDKTRVKFLVEIKREIVRFNSLSGHDH